jgi:CrcB protein
VILVLIALGGACGSVLRYLVGDIVARTLHLAFPIGTFVVNVSGCLLIGVLAKFFMHGQTELPLRSALIIGFCGGYTTFSTFSLETFALMQSGEWGKATLYTVLSCVVCVGATAAGFVLGRPLNP